MGSEENCRDCCRSDRRFPRLLMDNMLRRLIRRPRKLLERYLQKTQIVADLGSGPGFYTLPMAQILGGAGKVYAVDIDSASIEALKSKAERRGLQDLIETHTGSAAEINFIPNASVDFVFANGLLCCMLDHAGAIREIKRILKPSGRTRFSVARFLRKKDPRSVTKTEWEGILEEFKVLERGQTLTSRWALLSLK